MSMLKGRDVYKPFNYPRFFKRYEDHEKNHWMYSEVSMADDINDWNEKLTLGQKEFLSSIFRFFTQGDVDVAGAYHNIYIPLLGKLPELTLMMGSFANREGTHIVAYSYLIESLGISESTYSDFLSYKEMKEKQEYLLKYSESRDLIGKTNLSVEDKEHIAIGIAIFSGFTEGMQLFSTFAMLLTFPLNKLMKGMGKIVNWSILDETMHVEGMMDVFHTFLSENPDIRREVLEKEIIKVAREMVDLERAFIKLVFAKHDSQDFFGLNSNRLQLYIEHIADYRLKCMGYKPIYNTSTSNPLPELLTMTNAPSHTNFFENNSTDYSNISTTGSWNDVWGK